jgi:di/tripeptidase
MEEGRVKVSKRKGYYASKIKRATHMLFYRRHKKPGVKGWELRKVLGSDYPKALKILDDYLKTLDLQVKTIFEEEKPVEKPSLEQLDKARFYITLRGELTPKETKMIGWRIDDLAGLAITIAYIISKKGKTPRKEIEETLREKLPGWKVGLNIDRYIRYGYLTQDENEQLYLDWRTRAEVDQKALIDLILKLKPSS